MTRARAFLAVAAVVALSAGCNSVQSLSFSNPPSTVPLAGQTSATLPGNLPSVVQGKVAGATTTTLPPIAPGPSALNGSVFGPNGPVGGATVEADRVVGSAITSTRVTTAADGSWTIPNILGGRYRVRAWQSPVLAMTDPEIFFLAAGQNRVVTLKVAAFPGPDVATSVNPSDVLVGAMANLLVQVTNPTVGTDGVVRSQPQAGVAVTLTNGPAWSVYNGNPQTTGGDGTVLFEISCSQAGSNPLSVTVGAGAAVPVQTPNCSTPAPPTTPPPPCTTTTTTTTTRSVPAATTTTQPTTQTTTGGC